MTCNGNMAESVELRVASDLESKIDGFSEIVEAKDVDLDSKANTVISLWNALHKSLEETDCTQDFRSLFDKLYLFTARLILKGSWYTAITKNNYKNGEFYKNGLLEPLNRIIQDAIATYPDKIELCRDLKPLLDTSPWGLSYITDILSKDLTKSASSVDKVWEQENAVLLKVRIEILCLAKNQTEAFAFAQACYLKGYSIFDDPKRQPTPNENIQHNVYTKELYLHFTDIFYLLLCRINNTSKFHELPIPFIPTALEVVERLKSDVGRIAPKWKEWKKAQKTIIMAIVLLLTNQNQLEVDADSLKTLFTHWIRCTSKSDDGEEFRPVKEILSRINLIKTDYVYEMANAILENFSSHADSGLKFVQIYIRALSKDNNQWETLGVSEKSDSEVVKTFGQKLAQRYLRMAAAFTSDKEMNFEMTLTAFSLSPSEMLFDRLFQNGCNGEIVNETHKPIELTPELSDDLQIVTRGCRWSSLCWEKDKSELKQLCRQHLDTGGPKIKAKEDLTHLHIDYANYEPPPLEETDITTDYGFEKGYEPKFLEVLIKRNGLGSKNNLTKVVKTVQRKPFQHKFNNNKTGRKRKYPLPATSKIVNNYRLKQLNTIQSNDSTFEDHHELPKRVKVGKGRRYAKSDEQNLLDGSNNLRKSHHKSKKGGGSRRKTRPSAIEFSKMEIHLGSRLKKFNVTNEEYGLGASSSFVNPSLPLIYSTEHYRAMTDKDFCAPGDYDRKWNSIINSSNFLSLQKEDNSFDYLKHKLMKAIPVEKDFLSYLADKPIYNRLKLSCTFQEQNVQPKVIVQREIEPKFVKNVASAQALEKVLQFIQESLRMLKYAFENPACSSTLTQSLKQQVSEDDQLNHSSINTSQIIQEAYNSLSVQNFKPTSSSPSSQSSKSNVISHTPGPKSKMEQLLFTRAQESIANILDINSQALGLEITSRKELQEVASHLLPASSCQLPSLISNNSGIDSIPSVQESDEAALSIQAKKSMRMDTMLKSLVLNKFKKLRLDSGNTLVPAHSLPSENLTSSSDCLERLEVTEDFSSKIQPISVKVEEGLDNSPSYTNDNEGSATKIHVESATQSCSILDRRSDAKYMQQRLVLNVDNRFIQVANVIYGDFINGDLINGDTSESREVDDDLSVADSAQINPDKDLTKTVTVNTREFKQVQETSLHDESRGRELGKRRKVSRPRRYDFSPSPPRLKSRKWQKKSTSKSRTSPLPPANDDNNEVVPLPNLIIKIERKTSPNESLENQALYKEGVMFLNDQSGFIEPISSEQNLYFEEPQGSTSDQFWDNWEENFPSDTEDQIEAAWKKEMPPDNMYPEVVNNNINLSVCTCGQKSKKRRYSIYKNPYENNSLCKLHSIIKDSKVSLIRLSAAEINGHIGSVQQNDEEVEPNGDDAMTSEAGIVESPADYTLDESPFLAEDSTTSMTLQDPKKEDESLSTENHNPSERMTILEQTDDEVTSLCDLESEAIITESTSSEQVEDPVTFIVVEDGDDAGTSEADMIESLDTNTLQQLDESPLLAEDSTTSLTLQDPSKENESLFTENHNPSESIPMLQQTDEEEEVTFLCDLESEAIITESTSSEQVEDQVTFIESEAIITENTSSEQIEDQVTFIVVENGDDVGTSETGMIGSPDDDYAIQLDEAPLLVEDSTPSMTLQDSSKEDELVSIENHSPSERMEHLEQIKVECDLESEAIITESTSSEQVEDQVTFIESEAIITEGTNSEQVEDKVTFIVVENGDDAGTSEADMIGSLNNKTLQLDEAPLLAEDSTTSMTMQDPSKEDESRPTENHSPSERMPILERTPAQLRSSLRLSKIVSKPSRPRIPEEKIGIAIEAVILRSKKNACRIMDELADEEESIPILTPFTPTGIISNDGDFNSEDLMPTLLPES